MKIKRFVQWAGALAGIALTGQGCQPHQQKPPALPPIESSAATNPDLRQDMTQRVVDAEDRITRFQLRAQLLPGPSEAEHRKLMQDTFSDISGILPMIQGQSTDGAFRQQMRLIDTTASQLANLGPDLSSDPTIATGLRAAYNALIGMSSTQFPDRPEISKLLAGLGARLDELDSTRGAMIRQVQGEAVRQIGGIMQQMAGILKQRVGGRSQPMPATAPATMPATTQS